MTSDFPAPVSYPTKGMLPHADDLQLKLSRASNGSPASRESELRAAASEFESLFVSYLLKVMRETIEESGLIEGGLGRNIYTELFDQELARKISHHGGLGIADMLTRRLTATASPAPVVTSEGSLSRNGRSAAIQAEVADSQLPVTAPISSGYGMRRDPISREIRFHKGIDIAAPEGTEVRAAWGGKVNFAGYQRGYGNTIVVEHSDGLQTRYAHLSAANVRTGDRIEPEDVLGTVGSTGRSTGPHLHFEVTRWGRPVDPLRASSGSRATVLDSQQGREGGP